MWLYRKKCQKERIRGELGRNGKPSRDRDERRIRDNKDTQKEKREGYDSDEEKTDKNIRDRNFMVHTCLSCTQK